MAKHEVPVSVTNNTGSVITEVQYMHRYDSDVYNTGNLPVLADNATQVIGIATFWTGFLRTGYDYWWIQFVRDGKKYTCKANFYCYLTSDDKSATLKLTKDTMTVVPSSSSSCEVRIYQSDQLEALLTQEYDAEDKKREAAAAQ
jgi:hypothetical protein